VGSLAGDGIVEEPVSGKAAVTKYKVVERTSSGRYGRLCAVSICYTSFNRTMHLFLLTVMSE
jgi:hypothetical protein